jgi:hypothetical protein
LAIAIFAAGQTMSAYPGEAEIAVALANIGR